MIEIFGYVFYPAFFILLFFLIIAIMALLKLKTKIDKRSELMKYNKITKWQKIRIPEFLAETRENVQSEENKILLDKFIEYIDKNIVWDRNKVAEIDPAALVIFTTIFNVKAKEAYLEGDANTAVLLMHTIDLMNGGKFVKGEVEDWISSDVAEYTMANQNTPSEARMISIFIDAVLDMDEYVFSGDKGAMSPSTPPYLTTMSIKRTDATLAELESGKHIFDFEKDTLDVLVRSMFLKLDLLLRSLPGDDYLKEYNLYTVRCLAAALDGEAYDFIIKTIE